MVRIGKSGLDIFKVCNGNIVTDDKAIHNNGKVPLFIGDIAVAAGGPLLPAGVIGTADKSLGQHIDGEWLRPAEFSGFAAVELLGGISGKIVIEVSAADAVVAGAVFLQHIAKQHIHLGGADLIAAAVGGKMNIIQHQLPAVFHRDAGNGIAAVQVQELGKPGGNGQAAAQRRSHSHIAEGDHAAVGAAVRLRKGVHQESGVIIDGGNFGALRKSGAQQLLLVNVVAAGGIKIHLLEQYKIRLGQRNLPGSLVDTIGNALGAGRPGLRAAIHKESEIIGICAKTDILGHNGIFPIRAGRSGNLLGVPRRQRLAVGYAVIAEDDIEQIDDRRRQNDRQKDQQELEQLFHFFSPPLLGRSGYSSCRISSSSTGWGGAAAAVSR